MNSPLVTNLSRFELFDVDGLSNLLNSDAVCSQDKANLRKYKKRAADYGHNKVLITYDFSPRWSKIQRGRYYPTPFASSQTAFSSQIRSVLAAKFYWDVDFVNCQPTLLVQKAKQWKVNTPALEQYCDNREEIFAEMMRGSNLTRDEVKNEWIKVMFGGYSLAHPLIPEVKKELRTLALIVKDQCPEIWEASLKPKRGSSDPADPLFATLAVWVQNEERLCLLALDQRVTELGRHIDTFVYDGAHLRKLDNEVAVPDEFLRDLEASIEERTGYSLSLKVKPFHHSFQFKKQVALLNPDVLVNDEYAAKHLVRLAGDRLRQVGSITWVLNNQGIWSSGPEAVRKLISEFSQELVFRQPSTLGIRIFDYGGCEKNIPNLIKQLPLHTLEGTLPLQFAYTLTEAESEPGQPLELFKTLVGVLCNHQEPLETYMMNWFAHLLQKPFELPGVSLIITGKKGYGKDTLFDFFGQWVLGSQYFVNYTNNTQFFGDYDTGKLNKFLVKLEEADRAICLKNSSALKAQITSKTLMFNPKGRTEFQANNYCRFVLTTNKDCPVEFDNGERRFVLLASSGEKKNNHQFWQEVHNILFTEQGGKQVADFLLARDISRFIPQSLPENDYQEMVAENQVSFEERFLDSWGGRETEVNELLGLYNSWCRQNNLEACPNRPTFSLRVLQPLKRNNLIDKRSSHGLVLWRGLYNLELESEGE